MKQWDKGGWHRKSLEQMFQFCGYNPDAFVIELELIQSDSLENEWIVEGQYASETCMEEWGWSKQRIDAVKAEARKDPKHLMRKDKYEPGVFLHWAETCIKGQNKRSSKLELVHDGVTGCATVSSSFVWSDSFAKTLTVSLFLPSSLFSFAMWSGGASLHHAEEHLRGI